MNGFYLAHRVTCRAGLPRRVAVFTGSVVLGLLVVSLASHRLSADHDHGYMVPDMCPSGPGGQPPAVQATLADSPSWDRVRPAWPKYLPELPATRSTGCLGPQSPGTATVTSAADHGYMVPDGPAEAATTLPSIAAGPELFAPMIQPVLVARRNLSLPH